MRVGLWTLARKQWTEKHKIYKQQVCCLMFSSTTSNQWKKGRTFNVKRNNFPNHIFSSPDLYCKPCWMFSKFLRNHIWQSASLKNIKTLHNTTYFSKLSRKYFSANVTKFSEQLSLKPSPSKIVNEKIRTHVKFDNILLWKLQLYLKTWFSLLQFN